MNRGDVYTCRFDPIEGSEQGGVRPAVIVSRSTLNAVRRTVVVVPITSNLSRRASFHVALPAGEGGLVTDSVALGDQGSGPLPGAVLDVTGEQFRPGR